MVWPRQSRPSVWGVRRAARWNQFIEELREGVEQLGQAIAAEAAHVGGIFNQRKEVLRVSD